jgi:hypothetical protein
MYSPYIFFYSQHQLELQPPRTQFSDDSDELVLEDELQRIILLGKIDVHTVVTGMITIILIILLLGIIDLCYYTNKF